MLQKADSPKAAERLPSRSGRSRPSRFVGGLLMFWYCVGILLILDLIYSNFIYVIPQRPSWGPAPRVANDQYHHGLAANFSGHDGWGFISYPLYTNSLGFKDASARVVPLTETRYRVLLIGDSFTEGVGVPFDETFAGLLYRAGSDRSEPVEFLNAGVAGYSPVLYYKRIKYLLDSGLRFQEVIVFIRYLGRQRRS